MRSATAHKAAHKHANRPQSVFHPNDRRTRNDDPEGIAFMGWVRSLPCLICSDCQQRRVFIDGKPWRQETPTEFAHVGGNLAAKTNNFNGLPLCAHHHRTGKQSQENLKGHFAEHHGINLPAVLRGLRAEWEASKK